MHLSDLNPMQKLAVETLDGPVLILAGAGSGKTRTVTYRIANLIEHGVSPRHILALTFTNKAANEMKERIERLVGTRTDMWIGTFHSVCARILRRDIDKIGLGRDFVIYDEEDTVKLLKDILRELNIGDKVFTPKELRRIISDAKNNICTPDEWFARSRKDFRAQQVHDIFLQYERRLFLNNALDFDDLLNKTLTLLLDQQPVLQYYQNLFEYVHVDEYQDTNRAQYEFIRLLTLHHHNLCVVGDDDQSIYAWRGADIRNILGFEQDYPEAKVFRLEQNYRSTGTILDAANHVIRHNLDRKGKTLWTEAEKGDPICVFGAGDEKEEAAWICEKIKWLVQHSVSMSEICVLYRMHAQSRVMEEMLTRSAIPYRIFGGTRFYDRKEVKDALAYLRLILNPKDDISLERIINTPRRSIGDTTVRQLKESARDMDQSMFDAIWNLPAGLSTRAAKSVREFGDLLSGFIERSGTMKMYELVDTVIRESGLLAQYELDMSEEAQNHKQNLLELISAARDYQNQNPDCSLRDFMEHVALVSDLDQASNQNQYITLMTLHSAKGLEFDAVLIAGLEEGIFPMLYASEAPEEKLEEERRLFYVGITRARKYLYLSYAKHRLLFNQMASNDISRFIREIPPELMHDEWQDKMRRHTSASTPAWKRPSAVSGGFPPKVRKNDLSFGIPGMGQKDALHIPGVTRGFVSTAEKAEETKILKKMFHPGDKVFHRNFGEGIVTEIKGENADAVIRIRFTVYGEKLFTLSAAPIIKIDS